MLIRVYTFLLFTTERKEGRKKKNQIIAQKFSQGCFQLLQKESNNIPLKCTSEKYH